MRILGETVDNLAFFAMFGLIFFLIWLVGQLPIEGESKAILGLLIVYTGCPLILWIMLTKHEQ